MAKQTMMMLALAVALFIVTGSHARPYADDHVIGNDPTARYEVYVPDGTGNMAQKMLTIPEIRSLLARHADTDDFDTAQKQAHVSLADGERTGEQLSVGEKTARVDVSDVVSSVKTIMASRMAELDQEQKSLYADVQQTDEIPATTAESIVDVTEAIVSDAQEDAAATVSDVAYVSEAPEASEVAHDVAAVAEEAPVTQEEPAETRGDHEHHDEHHHHHHEHHEHPAAVFEPVPKGNQGLLATNQDQDRELHDLTKSSNKLAWQVWSNAIRQRSIENNEVMSPLALTSALGIAFLGARGSTAEAIDATLELDKLTSRNPHLHLQQVARDVDVGQHFQSAQSHMVYVDEAKSKVQDVFRARVDTLYGASLTSNISEVQRMVRSDIDVRSPFSVVSTASLDVAWPSNTVPVDQEEEYLHFLNLPSSVQVATGRRLVAVPTIRTTGHFYAGYDADLDATAVAVPLHPIRDGEETNWAPSDALNQAGHLSLVMVMPGSSSAFEAGGSGLAALEERLASRPDGWDHLLSQTKPHHLQVDLPKLGGESQLSLARALQTPALGNLSVIFDPRKADFRGISSARPLYLSDLVQMNKLKVSSVATIADEDEIHARKNDAKKRQGSPAKQVNKPKPTKVQTTVKTPCQEATDEAVEKALAAAMEAIRKVSMSNTAAKKPATPVKNQVKAQASVSVQSKPAQKKPVPAKQGTKPQNKVQNKPVQKKPQSQSFQARPQQKKPVNKAPVKQTPANKTPAKATAAKAPAKSPGKVAVKAPTKPINKTPVKKNPNTPAKISAKPINKSPVKQNQKAPVKTPAKVPIKQTPAKAPVKQTPAKIPAKKTPNKAPVKQTPEDEFLLIAPAPQRPVSAKPTTKKPAQKPTTKRPASKPTTKRPVARPTTKKTTTTTVRPKTTAKPTVRNVARTTPKVAIARTTPKVAVARTTPKVQIKTNTAQKTANAKTDNKKPVTNSQVKKPRVERDVAQHLSINRAFLYAVRHNPTGLLLMIGRYVHPEEY